ncbi:hypothetical protein [Alteromonas sp. CYL-A6]|uniref:hypothetical protein n=1 Tax=Alteromonas nitratireducens TaxID=3390813 RepID=UPI0034AE62BC
MLTRSVYTDILAVAAVALLIALSVMWTEAKKEVIYLCGNFTQGVSRDSVITQLDTANFLTYQSQVMAVGSMMIVRSPLHLDNLHCRIHFTRGDRVAHAEVRF